MSLRSSIFIGVILYLCCSHLKAQNGRIIQQIRKEAQLLKSNFSYDSIKAAEDDMFLKFSQRGMYIENGDTLYIRRHGDTQMHPHLSELKAPLAYFLLRIQETGISKEKNIWKNRALLEAIAYSEDHARRQD